MADGEIAKPKSDRPAVAAVWKTTPDCSRKRSAKMAREALGRVARSPLRARRGRYARSIRLHFPKSIWELGVWRSAEARKAARKPCADKRGAPARASAEDLRAAREGRLGSDGADVIGAEVKSSPCCLRLGARAGLRGQDFRLENRQCGLRGEDFPADAARGSPIAILVM